MNKTYKISVGLRSKHEQALPDTVPSSQRSRSDQTCANRRTRISRGKFWCIALLGTVSVSLALSGCGAFVGNASSNAGAGLLIASPGAVDFGTVPVGQKAASTVTLINKSASPIEISQLSLTGQSFSASSQSNLPVTLAAGSTINMTVEFDPIASGDALGQLSVTSSVSTAPAAVVKLKGKGAAAAKSTSTLSINPTNLSFGNVLLNTPSTQSITLASTGTASVTISAAAITGSGFTMSGVTFPVTLNPGQSATLNVQFDPTVTGSVTGQVTITSNSSTNGTAVISLSGTGTATATGTPTLSIDATSLSFGNVALNTPSTQSITLTSTGTSAVTVSAATITGAGFTLSGITFPVTLNPGQSATLNVQFDPTVTGAVTGQVTIASNSSTGSTTTVGLTGTGVTYSVDLSWTAPSSSSDPVAGYFVYRALSGSSSFQALNSTANTTTAFVDSTVASGQSYQYYVTSVDSSGNQSVPSNTSTVAIP